MAEVMVIDDDEVVRRVIRRMIEREGHVVTEAENGKKALDRLRGESVDLVITDVYMPEMDGLELLRHLRSVCPDARIVVMSGGGTLEPHHMLDVAKVLGADAILEKPFDLATVRGQLDALPPERTG